MSLFNELKRRNVIRVAVAYLAVAWLLTEVAGTLFPMFGFGDTPARITVIILAIGFPISLLLAWFYQVTPEGILPDEVAMAREGAAPATGRVMDFVVIAVMAAALLLFAYDKWYPDEAPARSIAVLPFVNMTADEEADHLGTGIAETILNMLAQMPELQVTSATSSFQSRLEGLSVPEIAGLLGVATVLEGSVQRQGNRVRVTAQLIDAENDVHLWSSNFDGEDTDIFKVQDEIAAAVTSALQVVMRDEIRQRIDLAGTDNAEAYDAYLQAEALVKAGKRSEAIPLVRRAIELDPEYALAHALLARLYRSRSAWPELKDEEREIRGRAAANRAVELAPDLPAALIALSEWTQDRNVRGQLVRRAYENGPNDVDAILAYAWYHQWDDPDLALHESLVRKALALDPLVERTYAQLTFIEQQHRRWDREADVIALWAERFPQSIPMRWQKSLGHWARGEYRSSIGTHLELVELKPERVGYRSDIAGDYLAAGMPEDAQRWMDSAKGLEPDYSLFAPLFELLLAVYQQTTDEEVFARSRQLVLEQVRPGNYATPWQFFVEYGERLDRLDEVVATFEELYPHLFADPPYNLQMNDTALYATGLALLRHGDFDRGEPLMRAFLEYGYKVPSTLYPHPMHINAFLALNERKAALEVFRKYADFKWNWSAMTSQLMFRYSVLYEPIRNEPEFIALLETYDQNAAEQRRLLQEADFQIPTQ